MTHVFATLTIACGLAGACAFGQAADRPKAPVAEPGRPIASISGSGAWDACGSERPPEHRGGPQSCQLCQLDRLRQVLETSRDRLAGGKDVVASLHDEGGSRTGDGASTTLEGCLEAWAAWVDRGMERLDPLMGATERARFAAALEACNQTIDQTLEAFQEPATPAHDGCRIEYLQREAAYELTVLRADNVRVLAQLQRTGGAGH